MSAYRSLLGEIIGCGVIAAIAAVVVINHVAVMDFVRTQLATAPAIEASAASASAATAEDAPQRSLRGVELRADARGHFNAEASINGRPIKVLVDTGATLVAMSYEDAERAGVFVRDADCTGRVHTANGVARVARVRLDRVEIGDIRVYDVQGLVSERGAMTGTLLGMSFLSKLKKVQMENGKLMLSE